MSADEGTDGFLCEFNDKIAKIYTLDRGLVEVPIETDEGLVLGDWYWLFDGEIDNHDPFESDEIKVWEENGEVFVQTCAISPNDFVLPKAIRDKFSLMVWSPFLNFLNDDNDIFINNFRGGDVGEIVVKYAPFEEHLFEVVKIVGMGKPSSEAYVKLTPWTLEYMAEKMNEIATPKPHLPCVDQQKCPTFADAQVGLCIKKDWANPTFCAKSKGSAPLCCLLFSPSWGLTRWSRPAAAHEDNTNVLGTWFNYSVNDDRKKAAYRDSRKNTFMSATARKPTIVPAPKPTRVVDGEVVIETSFKFQHDMLEQEKNRSIEPWEDRRFGLSREAHFFDIELGKVEIYPKHSKIIIEQIEKHRKMLRENDPKEYERFKNETIIVIVQVVVHNNFFENFLNYPRQGVFTIKKVEKICYLQGGKLIYEAAN